jgi:hypothetical protein
MSANKQLQRTVMDKVPSHMRRRAAAELRRYASVLAHRSFRGFPRRLGVTPHLRRAIDSFFTPEGV